MRIVITLVIATFFTVFISGQSTASLEDLDKKSRKRYEQALACIQKRKFEDGADKLKRVTRDHPAFLPAREQLAMVLNTLGEYDDAVSLLSALESEFPLYNPDISGMLARYYFENDKYEYALRSAGIYMTYGSMDSIQKQRMNNLIQTASFRQNAYTHPVDISPEKLDTQINTLASEYLPAFTADGSELIFTRRIMNGREEQEDLYVSYKLDKDNFSEAKPLTGINTLYNEGAHTISQDGRILIFTACHRRDALGGCDLYISFKDDENDWSEPVNMGNTINSRYWEAQPSLSADGKTLYFASTRPGGFGQSDIWRVSIEDGRGWSNPENLGPMINTIGNEASPFLHPDGRTLYFRSDGHIGMGGYDLFVSRKSSGTWSHPLNLGYPINTNGSEGALFVDLNGQKAYYSSDAGNKIQQLDIFRFDLPEILRPHPTTYLKLFVLDSKSGQPLSARLTMTTGGGTDPFLQLKTGKEGRVLTTVTAGTSYLLHVQKDGYVFYSGNISPDSSKTYLDPFLDTVYLQKIDIVEDRILNPVILENIFFESGSADLLPASDFEVNKLVDLLNDNSGISIKIVGHTDNIGTLEDNKALSEARARAVYNALAGKGIERQRLSYEGRGELDPVGSNDTEEGRMKNRRTEFIVSKRTQWEEKRK